MSETGEPPEVALTPWLRALLEAKAAGDDVAVELLVEGSSAADRDAWRTWTRRCVWLESEILAAGQALRDSTDRLAAFDAAADQDDAVVAEAERCGCPLYADGPADEHSIGTVRVVHHCGL
jgi:hypothetical protein